MEVVREVDPSRKALWASSRKLKVESWGTNPTPRLICVNAVDKGDRSGFGVKAVDKGVRDENRNAKIETRVARSESRNLWERSENGLVQKGKELAGAAGAGRVARGDFTGHDNADGDFVQYQSEN